MNILKKILTLGVVLTTIVWSMGAAVLVPVAGAVTLTAGDLIKASGPAVYFYAADGKRYTFPTESTYMSWYTDFKSVKTITDNELAAIDLAGNVVVRPGTNLVKIATIPKVFAVGPKGMLYHIASEAVATTLYGANWKNLITIIPDGFWMNYTDSGVALSGTSYPEGTLVKKTTGADVYYVNANGTWSKVTADGFVANRFNNAHVVTTTLSGTSGADMTATVSTVVDTSQGGGGGAVITGGALSVSFAGTPAASYVSKGVQNALFAQFNMAAGSKAVKVSKIVLQRKGLGYDTDLDTIRLYVDGAQVGSDQSLNTTTHKVTFSNLNWTVTAGTTKVLNVKANIAAAPSGTNNYFEVVEVVTDGTVSGVPAAGNAMQFSALSVGGLDVTAVAGSDTVISGATEKELGCWNLTTTTIEGFYIDAIKLTNVGSASSVDFSNLLLKVSSTLIPGSNVATVSSDNTVTFDLSAAPYFIDKSKVKKVCVYGDIATGITTTKTIVLQVADTKDVAARGDSSGGEVLITASNTTFTAQSSKTYTIAQGSATLAQDAAYAPATGATFVKGVANNKMAAYKLTAGSNEGVVMTRLRVTLEGTGVTTTDFSNWSLYQIVDGAEVLIPVSGSISGSTITFEDTTDGLLSVPKNESKTVIVKADVSTSAAGTEPDAGIYIGANGTTNTVVRVKGLDSGNYITDGVTLSGVTSALDQEFSIGAKGSLTTSKASTSPTAVTLSKGTSKVHFTTVNFYATGEDVEVTSALVTATTNSGLATSSDLINVYLTDEAGKQLGSTVVNPSSGEYSFNFSFLVPKETNKKIKIYGDIPTGTSATSLHVDVDTNTDVEATGSYSSSAITPAGTAVGSTMLIATPTVVAAMATTPITSSYVTSATGVTFGTLVLTAGTAENAKITSIKVSADDDAAINTTSTADTNFSNFKLVDANAPTTQYGVTQNLTSGTPDYVTFSGISNLTITKGQSKTLLIVADVIGTSGTFYFGVKDPSTEITGVGATSNASLTVTPGSAVASTAASITSTGTLKINAASDMPVSAQLVAGTTGNEVAKYKLEAGYENIDITALDISFGGTTANVSNFKLYANGTLIGNSSGYVMTSATTTVNLDAGTFVVSKDAPTYLTIKADLSPKAQLTTATTSTYFGLGDSDGNATEWGNDGNYNITAKGVSSGQTVAEANIDSLGTGAGKVAGGNAMTFHKGILTVSLNPSSPTGLRIAGANQTVIAVDLKATGDDITVNEMDFMVGGSCVITGTGNVTLKSNDEQTTYKTWTYTDTPLLTANLTTGAMTTLTVGVGETKTVKLMGDTTGCANPKTFQVTVGDGTGTVAGVDYADSSTTAIDLSTTRNLPVTGNSLSY